MNGCATPPDWPAIVGLEHEHGVCIEARTTSYEGSGALLLRLAAVGQPAAHDSFLENGGRLYLDAGDHPEYATPECSTLDELVASDSAGRHIMAACAARAEEALCARVRVLRNNVAPNAVAWGCHENYLVPAALDWGRIADRLASHLVSRIVVCGAGTIVARPAHRIGEAARPQQGPLRFRLSQREPFVDRVLLPSAVGESPTKPLVMSRDEPLADRAHWRRVQVVGGDATMAEHATWLRVGSTLVALRLVAAGMEPRVRLSDPIAALRAYSADPALQATAETDRGRWRALDLQRCWIDASSRATFLTAEEQRVVAAWAEVVDRLQVDLAAVADRVDWVAKWLLLDSLAARGASEARLLAADLSWHDVRPDRGLWSRAGLRPVVSPHRVLRAVHRPPRSTRAGLRGALVRALRHCDASWDVDWTMVTCRRPVLAELHLGDPHVAVDDAALDVCDALERLPHRRPLAWRWPSPEALRHESAGRVRRPGPQVAA